MRLTNDLTSNKVQLINLHLPTLYAMQCTFVDRRIHQRLRDVREKPRFLILHEMETMAEDRGNIVHQLDLRNCIE